MGHKVSPSVLDISRLGKVLDIMTRKITVRKSLLDVQSAFSSRNSLQVFLLEMFSLAIQLQKLLLLFIQLRLHWFLERMMKNKEKLEREIALQFPGKFTIDVKEVKKPELSASLVADSIARQIEKKLPYRRVIKNAISKTMEKGGLGIKVILGGRLNGAEIARVETYKEGAIPRQTIRADIDYSMERANTIYGVIGLKVWIYKGDIYKK